MAPSDAEDFSSDDDQDVALGGFADGNSEPLFSSTSFDNYFAIVSKPSRTSANTFSALTNPLSTQEYTSSIDTHLARPAHISQRAFSNQSAFRQYTRQLEEGFNIILYGAGSKRRLLNSFAEYLHNSRPVHVFVFNGTAPGFDCKEIVSAINTVNPDDGSHPRAVYLIVHNIDAPPFRSLKNASILSGLSSRSDTHMIASMDSIAFPVKLSLDSRRARQPGSEQARDHARTWLWHEITTLQPYDFELSTIDRSSLAGASLAGTTSSRRAEASSAAALLSPEAARHVLLSVTQKAKKLFALLGSRQLQTMDDTDASTKDPHKIGTEYSNLFSLAREDFIATNDTALRALMSEFRDHGLMLSAAQAGGAGEVVWIPMRKKALSDLVTSVQQGQL